MATSLLLRSLRRRELHGSSFSAYKSVCSLSLSLNLTGNANPLASPLVNKWASLARPFSSKPAGNEVIGIDLGTTNSCVAVMEGK
ncbi:hypothetical protein CRG98_018162, partial [Punica granatum]